MTPDESRALALLVREQPVLRPVVIESGWAGVSPEAQARAEALFREWWGWDVRHESTRHQAGKHDQKAHGRKGGGGHKYETGEKPYDWGAGSDRDLTSAISDIYQGGATLDPHDWSSPTTGICVARRKSDLCADGVENGAIIPADQFFALRGGKYQGESILVDYVDQRHQTFLSEEGQNEWGEPKVGIWHNVDDGMVYLDVTDVVPSSQKDAALKRGREQDQISVFDLDTFEEIPTGGSGRAREAEPGDHRRAASELGRDDPGAEGGLGERHPEPDGPDAEGLRHLAGKHDQKSHGRQISGGVQKGTKSRVSNPVDAPDGTDWDSLSPATKAKIAAKWAEAGLPTTSDGSPDIGALSDNIVAAYRQSSRADMEEGAEWYARAHNDAREIATRLGVSEDVGAGLLASLSPQTPWENNVVWADHAARMIADDPVIDWSRPVKVDSQDGLTVGNVCVWAGVDVGSTKRLSEFTVKEQASLIAAYGKQPMTAVRVGGPQQGQTINANYVIEGNLEKFVTLARSEGTAQDISTALGGHKTRSFYNGIATAGQTDAVTIDVHAFDVAVLGPASAVGGAHTTDQQMALLNTGGVTAEGVSGFGYSVTVAAYREATAVINAERDAASALSPAQVQAITWGGTLHEVGT